MSTEYFQALYPLPTSLEVLRANAFRLPPEAVAELQARIAQHGEELRQEAEDQVIGTWADAEEDPEALREAVDTLMGYFSGQFIEGVHDAQAVGAQVVGVAGLSEDVLHGLLDPSDFGPDTYLGAYCAAGLMAHLATLA